MSDRVLEGLDAARRAGWARAYAAERRVAELEEELNTYRDAPELPAASLDAFAEMLYQHGPMSFDTFTGAELDTISEEMRATLSEAAIGLLTSGRAVLLSARKLAETAAAHGFVHPSEKRKAARARR